MNDDRYKSAANLIRKAMDDAADYLCEAFINQAAIEATRRTCGQCGLACGGDEVDPCLGLLPGVRFACCGHGESGQGYIQFVNGKIIRFEMEHE